MRVTSRDYRFFRDHAGYVVGERAKGALLLARAEAAAADAGLVAVWEPEQEVDASWMSPEEQQQDHEVEVCFVYRQCGACGALERIPLASLGNIFDADSAYRRVVEAELFAEALQL